MVSLKSCNKLFEETKQAGNDPGQRHQLSTTYLWGFRSI